MMGLKFVDHDESHAAFCARSFVESELGRRYSFDEQKLTVLFTRGLRLGNLRVAFDDEKFAGCFWFSRGGGFDDFPYLRILSVNESMRGCGVGTFLMDGFEKLAAEETSRAFLLVSDFNYGARRFYERRGWSECGAIPDLYRTGIAELIMTKILK